MADENHKMNRRNFLKGMGIVGAGTIASSVAVPIVADALDAPKRRLSDLVNFDTALLSRNADGWWRLTFSASEAFEPMDKDGLVVEIGAFKFELDGLDHNEIRQDDQGVYHYVMSGYEWKPLDI